MGMMPLGPAERTATCTAVGEHVCRFYSPIRNCKDSRWMYALFFRQSVCQRLNLLLARLAWTYLFLNRS